MFLVPSFPGNSLLQSYDLPSLVLVIIITEVLFCSPSEQFIVLPVYKCRMHPLSAMREVSVIGAGISGLVASCYLADRGLPVTVFEKNSSLGGRARVFADQGFLFDMGPSWYWMPDVFESFFNAFGRSASDYFDLVRLDPGFQIILKGGDLLPVPADIQSLYAVFESREKGSSVRLRKFLGEAAEKYSIGMQQLVRRPAYSPLEFVTPAVLRSLLRMDVFRSVRSSVRSAFKDPALIALLEFPVLFLGAMPDQIPALYTLMNHAALTQGTFYPMGGMHKLVEAISSLAVELGVSLQPGMPVDKIAVAGGKAVGVEANGTLYPSQGVIAAADYHHVEQCLLEPSYRNYSQRYWQQKTLAPSCLLFYLGVSQKLPRLQHHNLFFDTDFEQHARDIYHQPQWPRDPLFYVCCPSRTDRAVAPEGMENLFVLIPLAPGLEDNEALRHSYFDKVMERLEKFAGCTIRDHLVVQHFYGIDNFVSDYHAYKGNAYGLANTLRQTAFMKPSLRNRKISNLFYSGQLTVPGPGLPPAVISGELAAKQMIHHLKKASRYEGAIR